MKRLLIASVVLVAIAALPLSHLLMAGKQGKVTFCHRTGVVPDGEEGGNCVNEFGTVIDPDTFASCGVIIRVSGNACPAHTGHGDTRRGPGRTVGTQCTPDFGAAFCSPE